MWALLLLRSWWVFEEFNLEVWAISAGGRTAGSGGGEDVGEDDS